MPVLSDRDIKNYINWGYIELEPYNEDNVRPASYDITISDEFINENGVKFKVKEPYIEIGPHEFLLATTIERVRLSDVVGAQLAGRSSLGRLGVSVHITAGWIDPGFNGQITMEMYNCTNKPVRIEIGRRVGQLIFEKLTSPCQNPYGSTEKTGKYQNQVGVRSSEFDKDVEVIKDESRG